MKKIFSLLLPLLVLFLLFPNIGSANNYSLEELNNLIIVEAQTIEPIPEPIPSHQSDESIILARRGGGGSRSFRSSPRRTTPKAAPKTWGNKNKKSISGSRTTPKGNGLKLKKQPPKKAASKYKGKSKRKLSKADQKTAAKARKAGKYHKDRKSARADFKKKNAGKYTSSYKTKPATRPAHVPQTTMVGGRSVNISYNVGFGGYGHMGPSGSWMMYNMMSDMIMMDTMMNRTGYVVASEHGTMVPIRGLGYYLLTLVYLSVIAVVIIAIIQALRNKKDS